MAGDVDYSEAQGRVLTPILNRYSVNGNTWFTLRSKLQDRRLLPVLFFTVGAPSYARWGFRGRSVAPYLLRRPLLVRRGFRGALVVRTA